MSGVRAGSSLRRLRLLGLLGVLVVLGIVADGVGGSALSGRPGQVPFVVVAKGPTSLAPVSAISSSWYCDVATAALAARSAPSPAPTTKAPAKASPAKAGSPAAKTTSPAAPAATQSTGPAIAFANTGPVAVGGTVSVLGEGGSSASVTVSVPAHGHAQLDETHLVTGPDVAATVVLDGGGVAVEQLVRIGKSDTVAPCASNSSASWYFASGSTLGSNRLLIALYNPLPTSAVADLSFATNAGPASPSDDQNVVVPSMSQVVLDVGTHVQQRSLVATTVSVPDGRLVSYEAEIENVSGHNDLTVALGASAAGSVWNLPSGLVARGAEEQIDIYNPASRTADVRMGFDLSFGSAVPLSLSVAPGSVTSVTAAQQQRIPRASLFGVQVTSTNGVGMVVERSFLDIPPQSQAGLTDAVGGVAAETWVVAAGSFAGSPKERVVVQNPGTSVVRVSVTALSGGAAERAPILSNQLIAPGRPVTLRLSAAQVAFPLVISSAAPVVVEQDLVGPGGQGVSSVLAEPTT